MNGDEQAKIWNSAVGHAWVDHATHYDATLVPFGESVLDRLAIVADERVVDVGCGTGATTVRIASITSPALVTGVDVSAPMLAAASRRALQGGVTNVRFIEANVEAEPLGTATFEVAFSRLGVMFFDAPEAGFTNIHRSLVDGGRLGFVCFQTIAQNPFIAVPIMAVASQLQLPPPPGPAAPSPFSLADPARIRAILESSGFRDIIIEPGPTEAVLGETDDPGLARRLLEQNPMVAPSFASASPEMADAAVAAAAEALRPHDVDGSIRLAASCWIVRATA
jgi:SAM-dependent methyltransferase